MAGQLAPESELQQAVVAEAFTPNHNFTRVKRKAIMNQGKQRSRGSVLRIRSSPHLAMRLSHTISTAFPSDPRHPRHAGSLALTFTRERS